MRTTFDDLRHALRSLRRSGRTSVVAVVLFAVPIGVTTAIYAIVEAVVLRPSAMRAADRVVVLWQRDYARGTPVVEIAHGEAESWRQGARSLDTLAVFSSVNWPLALLQGGSQSRVSYVAVSASFFDVAGVPPAMGRTFTARDEAGAEPRVAVIGDAMWRARFAGDPRVIGTLIRVREGTESPVRTVEIVGVMPPGFDFPRGAEMWLPAAPSIRGFAARAGQDGDSFLASLRVFYGLARVHQRSSSAEVAQELGVISRRQSVGNASGTVSDVVATPVQAYVQGAARPVLWTMFGGGLLMVLLASSTVAGLQVFRAALTDRVLAVHMALGAPRVRLVVRAMAEGMLLACAGVAGAFVVGVLVLNWLVAAAPLDVPRLDAARLTQAPVVAFLVGLAALVGVVAGVWPALFVARIDPGQSLTSGARAVMHPRERRVQRLVVGWQVAIAVVLLSGAALLVRSVQALDRTDAGFRHEGLASLEIQASFQETVRADLFYETLLARVREVSGVRAAGALYLRPLNGPIGNDTIPVLEGQQGLDDNAPWRRNPRANLESILPGSFAALGVPILSGRDFGAADRAGVREVVIVSASAAARYWPGRSALGQRLVVATQREPPAAGELRWQTVVGVVGDVRYRGLLDPRLDVYVPAAQSTMRVKDVLVRTAGDPEPAISRVRAIARELDPGVFVGEVVLMGDALARESAPWRFVMRVMTFFGSLAAVLATAGLVGVVWLVVAMRRRELGVRATLGAAPWQLRWHVLVDALWTGGAATLVGLLVALVLGRNLAGFLVGTSAHDPASLLAAAAVTMGAGLAGCLVAAQGAARTDPIEALRD